MKGRTISTSSVVNQSDWESRPLQLSFQRFHMHRQIVMSHNLVTEIKQMLTGSQIATWIAFPRDTLSHIAICLFTPVATQKPSPWVHPNPNSIWSFASDAICRDKSLKVLQALSAGSLTNRALGWAGETQCICMTRVCRNLASYDYYLVYKSLMAFAIVWGLVLALVPDHHFWSGSGAKLNRFEIGSPGFQSTQTVNSGTVPL